MKMKTAWFILLPTLCIQLIGCSRGPVVDTADDLQKYIPPGTTRDALIECFGKPRVVHKDPIFPDGRTNIDELLYFERPEDSLQKDERRLYPDFMVGLKDGKVVEVFVEPRDGARSVGYAAPGPGSREPSVEGKRLSAWLGEYGKSIPGPEHDGDPRMRARAEQAVRRIGTNALPWLLVELSAKEATRGDELPTNFSSGQAIKRRWLAATAFEILGSAAKDATSNLIPLLNDKQTSYAAATALGGIGVESIPVLIQALTNSHACARESAARVLGMFGAKAQSAMPALVRCTSDKDASVRGFAAFSLGQIGQSPEIVVPTLIANLRDPHHSVRWSAACALGKFGSKAKAAVPALLKVAREDDPEVRDIATDALQQIDPESGTKARVDEMAEP